MRYNVQKLIRARRLKGWTRARLAAEIGRSENLIYKIERGTRAGEATLFKIAEALDVPMKSILLRDEGNAA